jgi:DNA replication protein DnaC
MGFTDGLLDAGLAIAEERRQELRRQREAERPVRAPSAAFFGGLLQEPEWLRCECGKESMAVPCWDCCGAQREAEARRERALHANVPKGHSWATLENADLLRQRVRLAAKTGEEPIDVLEAANRVLGSTRALLVGPAGTGKTSLIVACLNARRSDAYFVGANVIGRERMTRSLGHGEGPAYDRAIAVPILVLDDLGAEGSTQVERDAVSSLIRERFADDMTTWVTTGLSSEQLRQRYDEAVLSRLMSRHGVYRLIFKGAERREGDR